MKVVLANKFFFRNGGSEAVLFQEREFLLRSGIEIVDFAMEHPRNEESQSSEWFAAHREYSKGGPLERMAASMALIHSRDAAAKMQKLIQAERPDVLHCHNIYHQLTPSIIGVAKRNNVPVVLTLHDYKTVCPAYLCLQNGKVCAECIDNGFKRVVVNRCAEGSLAKSVLLYIEAQTQRLLRNYDAVDTFLAPSIFMRDMVTRQRFPSARVTVLHNGVDTDQVTPRSVDNGSIVYLGRLSHEKGIEVLLRAHSALASDVRLIVAGSGPLESTLRHDFPRADFVGHLEGDELRHALRTAGVVVVPSNWYENCPMVILEAMAYARPVVASRIGGIPELVNDGETGLLVEPGNVDALKAALGALLADAGLRRRFGEAGRKRVEAHFSADQHNRKLLGIYSDLASRN